MSLGLFLIIIGIIIAVLVHSTLGVLLFILGLVLLFLPRFR
jgi:hypothetical protein